MNEPIHHHLDDFTCAALADGVLADGVLADGARAAAEAHLATCGDCRAALADVVEVTGGDGVLGGGAAVPAGLADRIVARLPFEAAGPQGGPMFSLRPITAVAALLIAAIGVALWSAARGEDTPIPFTMPGLPALEGGYEEAVAAGPDEVTPPPRGAELGGATRYLAHVSSDKPLYKPGEMMFARAVVLDAFNHKPVGPKARTQGLFVVKSARGDVVHRAPTRALDGVASFHWMVPAGQAGGQYKIVAQFPGLGTPEAELEFDIRAYRVPRLRTDLQFLSKAYGPGDVVQASLESLRAEGGVSANALVTAIARLDGDEIFRKDIRLDMQGRGSVRFTLPATIRDGVGTLALRIADEGITETAAKTLPIVLQRVDLDFYPEGGELIAGLPCGLYFEARTVRKDPADVAGRIVDDEGTEVATFASVHEGRGRLVFTPVAGRTYHAVLVKPAGIKAPVALPTVKTTGFSLRAPATMYAAGRPIRVIVAATSDTVATIGVFVRERELALKPVRLEAGTPAIVTLHPKDASAGVLRITIFDRAGKPHAERLVFRKPAAGLQITVTPDSETAVPGGKVRYTVVTKDALGRPVSAVVGLAATDDAVLATLDPRDRAARLPVQALLGSEVRELKDAHVYLAPGEEASAQTDLLLGTQGWRRFAFVAPKAFAKAFDHAGRRALALRLPPPPPSAPSLWGDMLQPQAGGGGGHAAGGAGVAGGGDGGDQPRRAAGVRNFSPFESPLDFKKIQRRLGKEAPVMDGPRGDFPPGLREPNDPMPPAPPRGKPEPVMDPAVDEEIGEVETDNDLPFDEAFGRGGGAGGRFALRVLKIRFWRDAANDEYSAGWVREFAHAAAPNRKPGVRRDFTETVYWHAGLKTDKDGRATIEFDASDAITTVRLRADGVSADGLLGGAESTIEVKRPFYAEPKFPLAISAGDQVQVPLVLVNSTNAALPISIDAAVTEGLTLGRLADASVSVPANSSARVLLPIQAGEFRGAATLRLTVNAGAYRDQVVRTIQISPAGFPIEHAFGGVLSSTAEHTFTIPERVLAGSMTSDVAIYPTPLASMTEALAALLREPGGCFEQTSSSNYPNVMALQYMQTHSGVAPAIVARATAMLERGYAKLASFECKERGYEWFGGDPGHEALTAYGVLEFHDMAQVMQIDGDMVKRTRTWLLARRDGKGGFKRNSRALDTFGGAPQDITDAYILWALLETATAGLEKEIAALKVRVQDSRDSYLAALAANGLWLAKDQPAARRLMARLAKAQRKDGAVFGAKTSITRSGGSSLEIETTALAVLAWLRTEGAHSAQVESAMRWMAARCQRGRFGSTQATILALKAIIAYDTSRAKVKKAGSVQLFLNGQPLHEAHFLADHKGVIQLPDLAETLTPGTHTIRLEMKGGSAMPYSVAVRYSALTPASAEHTPLRVTTSLPGAKATEGEPVEVRVKIVSTSSEGLPMAVAIVGLPGGLEPRAEQLKELVREGKADFIETRGREVILYWRSLAPEAVHELVIDCIAEVPGTYEGPASRAYLYYTDEHKHWVDGLKIVIEPK